MELLKYLENSDFFIAPSSTRFHGACKEGLLNHSLKVYEIFRNEVIEYNKNVSGLDKLDDKTEETIAICGLLHDLCKCNFYKESTKNVKNEKTGAWEKVPCYTVDEKFSFGHGEKSVFLIMSYMKPRQQRLKLFAIIWELLTHLFKAVTKVFVMLGTEIRLQYCYILPTSKQAIYMAANQRLL